MLRTRGLFTVVADLPPPPVGDTFFWVLPPSGDLPDDALWVIDGSLVDAICRATCRTGFGVVVVSSVGDLLACGCGVPPSWVHDAAGAEAWAYFCVVRDSGVAPHVLTDCRGVLDALEAGVAAATLPSKRLARIWNMVATCLDDDFTPAAARTTWMPAHGAASSIGQARDSRGNAVTGVMWRANRLADLLAKSAAAQHRAPERVIAALKATAQTVKYCMAKLGFVTKVANHYVVAAAGDTPQTVRRDSQAVRRERRAGQRRRAQGMGIQAAEPPPPPLPGGLCWCPRPRSRSRSPRSRPARVVRPARPQPTPSARALLQRRSTRAALQRQGEEVEAATQLATWMSSLELRPAEGDAAHRLSALRARVRAREARL